MASVFLLRRLPLWLGCGRAPQVALRQFTGAASSGSGSPTKTSTKTPSGDEYKVQEYFGYNPGSYYDFENTLIKYRLEQPVPGVKY